ncbi:DUF2589 domain-containing protein [Actinomadura sp. WMMB 499]|uniref:DUF2589 domain-containing protein n=1 Tax=Actinomadura sp. WMMB 499 TaxID=1219491 RepID=UPI00124566C9|nr:DUF2589 domain-containing protein [Actinomadura sp. WMMB 499]QFG21245.1 DUF2589 domain-containing protein [Actinomadura sp. WMMB 499]
MPDPNRLAGDPAESSLAVLRVEALLGAAYTAVVRAQAQAALEAVAVIDRVGFTTGADGSKTARVFEFAFHRHDLDPEAIAAGGAEDPFTTTSQVQVSVPVLSLITPPSLIIDEAEIDLALEVVGHDHPPALPREPAGPGEAGGADHTGPQDTGTQETMPPPAVIRARVATGGGEATLKVKSRLRQVPAGGTARIHQLLDTAISDLGHLGTVDQVVQDRVEAARLVQRLTALIDANLRRDNEMLAIHVQQISHALEFGATRDDFLGWVELLTLQTRFIQNADVPTAERIRAAVKALDAVAKRLAPHMTAPQAPPSQ